MKTFVKIIMVVLLAGVVGVIIVKIQQSLTTKKHLTSQLQHCPKLTAVQFTSKFTPALTNDKSTLIILFDPDCEHCQYEATQIRREQAAFSGAAVYWLTTQPMARARQFAQQYGLDSLATMHVGTLTREESNQMFGPTSVPHIFIYGRDGELKKEYKGEVKIAALLQYL